MTTAGGIAFWVAMSRKLIIAKNRKDLADTVKLPFKPETTTFHSFSSAAHM